jgi:cobalt-zinc-cadmium efflux system membrane fusion protein
MDAGEIAQLHAEFLKLKNELTLKKNIFTRESELFKANVSSRQELELSESEFRSAQSSYAALRQRLLSNGIAPDDFDMYSSSASALSVLRMRAPFTGTVVDRQATIGQYVDTHTPLMTVADLSKMWAEISLPADAAGSLSIGDSVQVEVDVAAGSGYSGSITWISTAVDPTSRTIKARAEITNDDGKLRSGVFAKARLLKADVAKGFLVSADAVQRIDKKDYVFVASPDDDLFEVRSVNIGMRQGEFIQVVSGLSGSEAVVSTGAFSLKSELLRSKFGAGCCEPLE